MKKILSTLAVMAGLSLAEAQIYLAANLDGLQEVGPNASPGTGSASFTLNLDGTVTYSVSYTGLLAAMTASHIHGPAGPGVNAGVLVGLAAGGGTSGAFSGTTPALTLTQQGYLTTGMTYINIHSGAFPGGEIRGQIYLVPEPGLMALGALGGGLWLGARHRRRSW